MRPKVYKYVDDNVAETLLFYFFIFWKYIKVLVFCFLRPPVCVCELVVVWSMKCGCGVARL